MNYKKSLTLLSIISLICLLLILISGLFFNLTIYEVQISTIILSTFASRVFFRERIRILYVLTLSAQFFVILLMVFFLVVFPIIGLISIIYLILTIFTVFIRNEQKLLVVEFLLLFFLLISIILYIANFPLPME